MAIKMPKTGLSVEQASTTDLEYWAKRIQSEIDDGKAQKPEWDALRVVEMNAELARRKAGGQQTASPKPATNGGAMVPACGQQLAKPQQALAGSYLAASVVDAKLREAASNFHLVSPATSCGSLPEGCEVAISVVHVNPLVKGGPGDVAPVGGGKLSLSGNVLKRIAAAAGVDWDPNLSRRLDNARDPHYVHFRAVGYVRLFDGTARAVTGEVEIDMRENSPQIVAMQQRAKEGANIESQIRDTRLFILRHAETKAKLRAIVDMGVKRSYTDGELQKPFAVARLMFTGRTQDPELKRLFASKIADSMLGGSRALYGGAPQAPALSAPGHVPQLQGHDAPPAGSTAGEDADYDMPGEGADDGPEGAGDSWAGEDPRAAGAY